MTRVTCRLTAKNRDQLRNPTLGNRVPAIFDNLYSPVSTRTGSLCLFCCCTAIGCADVELPTDSAAHVLRSDDTADVICNHSSAMTSSVTSRVRQEDDGLPEEPTDRHQHHQPPPPMHKVQQKCATFREKSSRRENDTDRRLR